MDHSNFMEIYTPLHNAFIRYCSSRAVGIMSTEDLAQEAILAALSNFEKIKDRRKLLGYLIGVVNNILKNKHRQAKFQANWDDSVSEWLESRMIDPETAMAVKELLEAIEKLPEKDKEAVLLFEVSGFSIEEIADIQTAGPGAVKTRLSRARQKLRRQLELVPTAEASLSARVAQLIALL